MKLTIVDPERFGAKFHCDWCGLEEEWWEAGPPDGWLEIDGIHICGLCRSKEIGGDCLGPESV